MSAQLCANSAFGDPRGAGGDFESQSIWFPSEGYCFTGELKGELLDPVVRMQCTWQEWKELHPETVVLAVPDDPKHRNPRDGHGSEEFWCRPGMDNLFIASLPVDFDRRFPENEPIVAVSDVQGMRAYSLYDVKVEGGVVNDRLGDLPLALLAGPEQDSIKAQVWERRVGDRVLEFELREGAFVDTETSSVWTIEGKAVKGPLAGTQLEPVYFYLTRWHSWCYTHPATEVWRPSRQASPNLDLGIFAPAVDAWRASRHDVKVERAILNLELPLEAVQGFMVRVDGDRFRLLLFDSALAADDYTCFYTHGARRGLVVLESFPDEQYTDIATHQVRLPDHQIDWSQLLDDEAFVAALDGLAPSDPPREAGLRAIVDKLAAEWDAYPGYATPMNQDIPFHSPLLAPIARFPGVSNGVYVTIGPDPFIVYRFETVERARRYVAEEERHVLAFGRYVFRSIPANMFMFPRYGMVDRTEDKVDWSELLDDQEFVASLRALIGEPERV